MSIFSAFLPKRLFLLSNFPTRNIASLHVIICLPDSLSFDKKVRISAPRIDDEGWNTHADGPNVPSMQIYLDSELIVAWCNGFSKIDSSFYNHHFSCIINSFHGLWTKGKFRLKDTSQPVFQYIYRERNNAADRLANYGAVHGPASCVFSEICETVNDLLCIRAYSDGSYVENKLAGFGWLIEVADSFNSEDDEPRWRLAAYAAGSCPVKSSVFSEYVAIRELSRALSCLLLHTHINIRQDGTVSKC